MTGLTPSLRKTDPPTSVTPMPGALDVTVVIPAHNEEGAVAQTVERVREVMETLQMSYEIVLVDDGSADGTRAEAERAGARVIASPVNRGYGWALKRGIGASQSRYVLILDADGTYPPEAIPELMQLAPTAEMVVGDRSGAMGNVPWIRRPAKWVLSKLANFLAEQKIPDLNSGLRVFDRHSLERFIALLPDGFSFTSTITLCMICSSMRVVYVPIHYGKRIGHSKVR